MKDEDKELLLRDLCRRLPYGVKVHVEHNEREREWYGISGYDTTVTTDSIGKLGSNFKPYLRPMSSMTDAEWADCVNSSEISYDGNAGHIIVEALRADARARWYDEHMFDHRGLLPKGLAIEMPKEMYKS